MYATRRLAETPDEPALFRTHDWLGRERVGFRAHGRRYLFRTAEAAVRARRALVQGKRRRASRRPRYLLYLLPFATLLAALWLNPPMLVRSVDLARAVVGPAPVAYLEGAVFRAGTLVREARVSMGDTAPRWTLEGAQPPIAAAAPVASATPATPTPTPLPPTATPPQAAATPTPWPTEEPAFGAAAIVQGGNLRSAPRIAHDTELDLVWPGDRVAFLERRVLDARVWYRVRVTEPAADRAGRGASAGAAGWISAALLTKPAPTPSPPPRILPTPAPPHPQPAVPQVPAQAPAPIARGGWPPAPIPAPIADGQVPGEGQWRGLPAIGDGGSPAMAVTTLRPDAARPDIQVAIVAIDLDRALLHLVPGTQEPPGPTDIARRGAIPADVQQSGRLLAAFNGGFKAIHGNDGMGVDGVTYLAPVDGRATIAVASDGAVRLGVWGRDFSASDGFVAWRQNGMLLVDGGAVTDRARQGGLGWGASVDLQAETWRSGVGLSADGRTLLYAVGDGLTAERLAEVLRAAGAWRALQLDINNYWVRFVTFQPREGGGVLAQPLISAMAREPSKYLAPEERDFMYLTAR
jgi:hypothetical protein